MHAILPSLLLFFQCFMMVEGATSVPGESPLSTAWPLDKSQPMTTDHAEQRYKDIYIRKLMAMSYYSLINRQLDEIGSNHPELKEKLRSMRKKWVSCPFAEGGIALTKELFPENNQAELAKMAGPFKDMLFYLEEKMPELEPIRRRDQAEAFLDVIPKLVQGNFQEEMLRRFLIAYCPRYVSHPELEMKEGFSQTIRLPSKDHTTVFEFKVPMSWIVVQQEDGSLLMLNHTDLGFISAKAFVMNPPVRLSDDPDEQMAFMDLREKDVRNFAKDHGNTITSFIRTRVNEMPAFQMDASNPRVEKTGQPSTSRLVSMFYGDQNPHFIFNTIRLAGEEENQKEFKRHDALFKLITESIRVEPDLAFDLGRMTAEDIEGKILPNLIKDRNKVLHESLIHSYLIDQGMEDLERLFPHLRPEIQEVKKVWSSSPFHEGTRGIELELKAILGQGRANRDIEALHADIAKQMSASVESMDDAKAGIMIKNLKSKARYGFDEDLINQHLLSGCPRYQANPQAEVDEGFMRSDYLRIANEDAIHFSIPRSWIVVEPLSSRLKYYIIFNQGAIMRMRYEVMATESPSASTAGDDPLTTQMDVVRNDGKANGYDLSGVAETSVSGHPALVYTFSQVIKGDWKMRLRWSNCIRIVSPKSTVIITLEALAPKGAVPDTEEYFKLTKRMASMVDFGPVPAGKRDASRKE